MTDEEKKAIERIEKLVEYLKKWNKNFIVVPEDVKYFEKILDMTKTHIRMIDENIEEILEQSKEIEELKEKNKITKQMNENLIEVLKGSISIDKIKETIEELENEHTGCATNVFSVLETLKNFPITITKEELEKRWKE